MSNRKNSGKGLRRYINVGRLAALLPMLFLLYISEWYCVVAVEPWGLYLSWREVLKLTAVVFVIWFMLPVKKFFRCGGLPEAAYYCLPVEGIMLLFFAEYHAGLSIGLLAVSILLSVLICIFLLRYCWDKQPLSKKRIRRLQCMIARCSIILMAGIWLFPSVYAFFIYNLQQPVYISDYVVWEKVGGSITVDEMMLEQEEILLRLREEVWQGLELEERMDALQTVADIEAQKLMVEPVALQFYMLDEDVLGDYAPEEEQIRIDIQYVKEDTAQAAITTVCHEMFHHYQYYIVENIDWGTEVASMEYFAKAKAWKDNMENYTSSGVEYYEQALEADARAYGEAEYEEYQIFLNLCGENQEK